MNAINSATTGLLAANSQLDQIASRVASGSASPIQDTVDELGAKQLFQANIAVLKTAEQMTAFLVDLKI